MSVSRLYLQWLYSSNPTVWVTWTKTSRSCSNNLQNQFHDPVYDNFRGISTNIVYTFLALAISIYQAINYFKTDEQHKLKEYFKLSYHCLIINVLCNILNIL